MAIDPNIALSVRPFQAPALDIPDPVEQFGKVLTLQNLMQQRQSGALKLEGQQLELQQARQAAQERADMMKYLRGLGEAGNAGGPSTPGTPGGAPVTGSPAASPDPAYMLTNFPTQAPAFLKGRHDAQMAVYDEAIKNADVEQKKAERRAAITRNVADEPSKMDALAQLFQEKLISQPELDLGRRLPWNSPMIKGYQDLALNQVQHNAKVLADTQEARAKAKEEYEASIRPFQKTKAEAEADKAKLDAGQAQVEADFRTLAPVMARGGQQAVAEVMKDWAPERKAPFVSAANTGDLVKAALSAKDRVTAEETALRDKQSHDIALAHLNIARKADERAEQVYQNTYGPNANQALVGVDPKLRVQATSAAQKAADAFSKANAAQEDIKAFLDLAKQGNKEAYAYMSPEGVLTLNTGRGVTRVNMPEIEAYAHAGSLIDQLKGKIGKITTGASISKDVLKDIGDLHERIHQNAVNAYNSQLDSVNQNYHSNFQPIKSAAGGGGSPATARIPVAAPNGKTYYFDNQQDADNFKKSAGIK